jgi:adenine-specific DNA glycosylase
MEILDLVSPLGLGKQRVGRLKAMARAFDSSATLPVSIPGVGSYGSAVIALSSGVEPVTVPVDGNIARIVCRYYGFTFERGEARKKKEVKEAVDSMMMARRSMRGRLSVLYALVDFGNGVCRPVRALHQSCPLVSGCVFASEYRQQGKEIRG